MVVLLLFWYLQAWFFEYVLDDNDTFFFPRVKPAAFDLFLGGCIAGYLGIVYYAIQVCL